MRGTKYFLGSFAIAGVMLAASVQVGAVGAVAGRGLSGGADSACRVSISRNAAAGVFKIARQTFSDGSCRCIVSSGPAGQSASADAAIVALRTSRSCSGAANLRGPSGSTPSGGLGGVGTIIGGTGGGPVSP